MNDNAVRKAAVFLMTLGPDVGGQILSRLPENMVEELTHSIAGMGPVGFNEKKKTLNDFISSSGQISGIATGGQEMAKQILEAGFGARRATSMLSRVTSYSEIKSFEHLKDVDPLTIAAFFCKSNTVPRINSGIAAVTARKKNSPIPAAISTIPSEF